MGLNIGDTIKYNSWADLVNTANGLTKQGYQVEVKGWDGMRFNRLTIVATPEEKPKPLISIIEQVTNEMCDNYCKYSHAPVPEGKSNDWLFDDPESPCNNCPLNKLV